MAYDGKTNRLRRKEAVGMDTLVQDFIREMKIASGLNRQRVMEAWNVVSGASRYTLDVFFDKGILYCTLNSSMARSQLYFQKDAILERINEYLAADELFAKDPKGGPAVKNIIFR